MCVFNPWEKMRVEGSLLTKYILVTAGAFFFSSFLFYLYKEDFLILL